MDQERDYRALVKQAQLGDRASLDNLSRLVWERLYAYVYRIVLREDLAQDIVQESMLEMFKIFGKLERADRFWPWLRGIAFNKIRRHYTEATDDRKVPLSRVRELQAQKEDEDAGLAKVVGDELKQVVFAAMGELRPRYRKVLTMRCYEEMEYSEIAELLDCSELVVRVLFFRAKKSLQRALGRKGFGKGFVLVALVLFGKMTAPTKAAAAQISVTVTTTKVGVVAGLIGMAASKTALVLMTTAGVLAIGTMVPTSGPDETPGAGKPAVNSYVTKAPSLPAETIEELWYYFPKSADGPVMMRVMKSDSQRAGSYCAWRQDDRANYYFDKAGNTIYINNHRMYGSDLAVQRLPTDKAKLREFLVQVEGGGEDMEYVPGHGEGLLVIIGRGVEGNANWPRVIRHQNVLDEECFRYDWPAGIRTVDNRDAMHRRGWTYFRVEGEIDGEKVSGVGRMPFVYAASTKHGPWLRLNVGHRLVVVDAGTEALVYNSSGQVTASYAGGSFFRGLARPWVGLHTIDVVRRDAAGQQVWFETKYDARDRKAEVILTCTEGKLVYAVDMEKDVIEKVAFSGGDGTQADLRFSYLQDIDGASDEFVQPRITRSYGSKRRQGPGLLWLVRLARGNLGK
ncbi:MAG: RNA polymerase sigma factor [Planctomycetota bacterium]|jgi:RNA polymerase sigma-70 factor (ECF subfamily)